MRFLKCLIRLIVLLVVIFVLAYGALILAPDAVQKVAATVADGVSKVPGLFPPTLPTASKIEKAHWMDQNWSARDRYWFHHTPQGTATFPVPYDWLLALEQPRFWLISKPLLSDEDYLRRFGFIPSPKLKDFKQDGAKFGYQGAGPAEQRSPPGRDEMTGYPENPDGLPVGFARMAVGTDPTTGEGIPAQIGFTCAACHTGHIEYKNVSIRFDGGPAMVNLGALEKAIGLSLFYTLNIPFRFERFAERLDEKTNTRNDREDLRADMELVLEKLGVKLGWEGEILQRSKTQHTDEGFGRLDALNRIGNQVFFEDMLTFPKGKASPVWWAIWEKEWWEKKKKPKPEVPEHLVANFAPHDAPVSFPPIWDVPWFLWAQYDASIFNELVRNAGEALGVGAKVNMTSDKQPLFKSSIPLRNVYWFEEMLRGPDPFAVKPPAFKGLVSPKWSEAAALFKDDPAWQTNQDKVREGRWLYRELCVECHRGPVNDPEFDAKFPPLSFWADTRADVQEDRRSIDEKNWIDIKGRRFFNVVQKRAADMGTDDQQAKVLAERTVSILPSLRIDPTEQLNEQWKCGIPKNAALNTSFALSLMAVVDRTINQWFKDNPTPDLESKMRGTRPNCPNPRSIRVLPPPESEAEQKLGRADQQAYAGREQKPDGANKELITVPLYRARPLDGVWATAPYLHNGSVPTLMDMLTPQNERPKAFCVGSRQFDPVNVGLPARDQSGKPIPTAAVTCAAGLTKFDARELGNSNLGHSFEGNERDKTKLPAGVIGRELKPVERDQLVEYLKTL